MERYTGIAEGKTIPRVWVAALVIFVIAGSTGTLLRFGLLYGFPGRLQLANVRHAHSHLMYFGWVTPAIMGLMAAWLPRLTGRELSRRFQWVILATVVASLLAYLMFLPYGYQPAQIGESRLPLSVMAASMNILCWYAFGILYFRQTRSLAMARGRALRFWDAALIFQILASMGAWGIALLSRLGVEDPFWSLAMTHLFLDLFSEGWMVLALLGLIYATHEPGSEKAASAGEQLIVIGLPVTFFLAMPVNMVSSGLRLIAAIGGLLVAAGLLLTTSALWRATQSTGWTWRVPLSLLALKALLMLGMLVPSVALWAQRSGLRIFYLHVMLLGFVTLGLIAAGRETWGYRAVRGSRWFMAAVLLLLLSLIPMTGLWPETLGGRWVLQFAAWATLGPLAAATGMITTLLRKERDHLSAGTAALETRE